MPNSNSEKIVSCAADGSIYLTDLNESTFFNNQSRFDCHGDKACYKICNYIQDNKSFATCGQDGCVKVFDLRVSSRCKKMFCNEHTLIKLSTGISALAINPMVNSLSMNINKVEADSVINPILSFICICIIPPPSFRLITKFIKSIRQFLMTEYKNLPNIWL
jgi:WD40 repeat protein